MISSTSIAQNPQGDRLQPSHTRGSAPQKYNLKLGNLQARLRGAVQMEASDNITLSDQDPEADLGVGPQVDVGFFWPITQANVLELDLGVGYRFYLDHPAIQSVETKPESYLEYRILFPHGTLSLRDNFAVQVDPTSRPDLSGSAGQVEDYRRIENMAGLAAEWRPLEPLSFVANYDFELNRSISGEFTSLDRNGHNVGLAGYYQFDVPVTAGFRAIFSSAHYLQQIQNDSRSWNFGPVVYLQPSDYITVDASVGYSISSFDSTGTVADDSEFEGFTGQLGINHRLNRRISHQLRFAESFQLGLGSNFYELLAVHYSLHMPLGPKLDLSPSLGYEHYLNSSAVTEKADRYLFQLRSGWRFGRRWSLGAAYSFITKDSNIVGNDYRQNRVTLDLTREF